MPNTNTTTVNYSLPVPELGNAVTYDIARLKTALIAIDATLFGKQDALLSGTNIKTINGNNLLGSGNITISGGSGGTSLPTTTEIGKILTSQGSNPIAWSNFSKHLYKFSGSFTAPFTGYYRFYLFGAGGKSYCVAQTTANSGGGGGCAYGDIYMLANQTATLTTSTSLATLTLGGVIVLTALNGGDATASAGGIGGTASQHISVLNGGAFSGGNGMASSRCAAGAPPGSPFGTGRDSVNNESLTYMGDPNEGGMGVIADCGQGASRQQFGAGRTILTTPKEPIFKTCTGPCAVDGVTKSLYGETSLDGAGAAYGCSGFGGFMGGGGDSSPYVPRNGRGGFGGSGGSTPTTPTAPSGEGAGRSANIYKTAIESGGAAACLVYY